MLSQPVAALTASSPSATKSTLSFCPLPHQSSSSDDGDGLRVRSAVRLWRWSSMSAPMGLQKAWDAFGKIDALVNNAGIRGGMEQGVKNKLYWNLLGVDILCKRMPDAGRGGSVINISSISGVNRGQLSGAAAYASSKAGLNMLTRVMALELGEYKIRVKAISLGLFKSEIMENLKQKAWLSNVAARTVPLREHGTLDSALTSLVRYLIHDSSLYVSGNVFIVDAGATLPSIPTFSSL